MAAAGDESDAVRTTAMAAREKAVTGAIRAGDVAQAVRTAIASPPFGTKDKALKVSAPRGLLRGLGAAGPAPQHHPAPRRALGCRGFAATACRPGFSQAKNFDIVETALLAARTDEAISGVVAALSEDECDLLMKFIYRGLESGTRSAAFLKWHAITLEKAGKGSIMRVITDKRQAV